MNISQIVWSAKCGVLGALVAMGMAAVAEPTVTVGEVQTGEPWSKITVNYTLGGTDAKLKYKVAFDVTAGGQTASVTNEAANLTDGAATKEIDTVALFGKQVTDTNAKVKVTLLAIKPKLGGVQLWKDGPFFAESNIGATNPEDYGLYFWWGDTVGYEWDADNEVWVSEDGTKTCTFFEEEPPANTLYDKDPTELDYLDANGNLKSDYDAATVKLGAPWRMPTKEELDQLMDNCVVEWTGNWNNTGVAGVIVKGKGDYAANSVFFPAAGYVYSYWYRDEFCTDWEDVDECGLYWSSTQDQFDPSAPDPMYATCISLQDGSRVDGAERYWGLTIRPVRSAK